MTASNMGNGPEKNFNNAKEDRKLRKPLIEKRRRERINCSLEQLKGIMVDAYNLDHSKLEKADVLEVTVQHMEGLQNGHAAGSPGAGSVAGFESRQRYSSGYIQCIHEVHNLLLTCPGMDKTLGATLLNHLLKSLPHISSDIGRSGSNRNPDSPDGGCGNSGGHVGSLRTNGNLNGIQSNITVGSGFGNYSGSIINNGSPGRGHSADGASGSAGCGSKSRARSRSPPSSPLSLPLRTRFKPRRLLLHSAPQTAHRPPGAASPGEAAHRPPGAASPGEAAHRPAGAASPGEAAHRPAGAASPGEAASAREGSEPRENRSASSDSLSPSLPPASPPSSPVAPQPPLFMSPGDPLMWRPW